MSAPRRLRHAVVALALGAAAFVHAGAPLLDELLYHRGGQPIARLAIHFDKPGGCGQHAEQCAISSQRPSLAAAPSPRHAVRRVLAITEARFVPVAPDPHAASPRRHPASRAPPTTRAA